jgi:hypothetical protein
MSDGNPIRDNGPYLNADQARAQYDAVAHGIPAHMLGAVHIPEALMLAGVATSPYEHAQLETVASLPPEVVQVIAGWIIRASINGRLTGEGKQP